MPRRLPCTSTLDLLEWTPPETTPRFDEAQVRGVALGTKICHAMKAALKECGKSRDDVAAEMSAYLGEDVSVAMLNAYVSEARETHTINLPRFIALIHATEDHRLVSLVAEQFGLVVMPHRYERLIKAYMKRDWIEETQREIDAEMRRAKRECGL